MYFIEKTFEISASHKLQLSYRSKCENLHGHNWKVTVMCKSRTLDENGMVVDFSVVKNNIQEQLDHKNLNDILPFNCREHGTLDSGASAPLLLRCGAGK